MLKLIAIGHLTKALDIQQIQNVKDMQVANFTLACRNGKETEFVYCSAWNEIAKTIKENTGKGSQLYIMGKYKSKSWVDDKTQIKHTRIFITVEEFEFLDPRPKASNVSMDV